MPTGKAARLSVTSMGTWCKLGKQMLDCPCMSHMAVEGSGGTSGAHTFTCETWYGLLVLPQEGIPALTHST